MEYRTHPALVLNDHLGVLASVRDDLVLPVLPLPLDLGVVLLQLGARGVDHGGGNGLGEGAKAPATVPIC